MQSSVKKEFIAIVGPERVLDSPEQLIAYSYDGHAENYRPEIVLLPLTTEEVAAIMKVAYRESIPVTPRGSGTNVAGSSVPARGGIVLCLSMMNKIINIDPRSLTATVEPGLTPSDLQKAINKYGLMYPPDPSTMAVASIGGTVATNAGGPKSLKYGVTKDYLLGLTAVLPNGDVLKTGGGTLKNVTGYNLTALLCGSEGTLAIITKVTVRLIPKPRASKTIRADFIDLDSCSNSVADIMAGGIVPAALEFMDKVAVKTVEQAFHLGLPTDLEGMLLVQVDGAPETLDAEVKIITEVLEKNNANNIVVAQDDAQVEELWTARRAAGPAIFRLKPNVITEDITVPVANFAKMVRKAVEICSSNSVTVGILAHAGDGNLHPCVVFDKREEDEVSRVEKALAEMAEAALSLGGTLSGEHGIGMAKEPFLHLEMDQVALGITKRVKDCFDPKLILNPGKFV